MCRIVAYRGSPIALEEVVVRPVHSLLAQSHDAHEAKVSVNGDGFGIAWYDGAGEPGLYKDVSPAWSDANLAGLCRMIRSPHFLAHVRAATQGEISRANCHPFTSGNWAFAHNGAIGGYRAVRREIESGLSDTHYLARSGTTDSELIFLAMLENGLEDDPPRAISRTIRQIHAAVARCEISAPVRLTCAVTNGDTIHAFRHGNDGKSPSLYMSQDVRGDGSLIASEPLCGRHDCWTSLMPDRLYAFSENGTEITELL
jgi:predicted glutamine amidotransferase